MKSAPAMHGRPMAGGMGMVLVALALLAAVVVWAAHSLPLQEVEQAWPSQHALQSHHGEIWNTEIAMTRIQARACDRMEAYWSEIRKSYLILCRIHGELWGSMILRRAKDYRLVVVTAYAAHRSHWDKVLVRDGYQPVALGR